MANPSKRKGSDAETKVVDYLRRVGFPFVERRALAGVNDKGDIAGIPSTVIEVKACKTFDLAGWADERDAEVSNADAIVGAVWAKRRGKGDPGDWYVILDGATFAFLLTHWRARLEYLARDGAA